MSALRMNLWVRNTEYRALSVGNMSLLVECNALVVEYRAFWVVCTRHTRRARSG